MCNFFKALLRRGAAAFRIGYCIVQVNLIKQYIHIHKL